MRVFDAKIRREMLSTTIHLSESSTLVISYSSKCLVLYAFQAPNSESTGSCFELNLFGPNSIGQDGQKLGKKIKLN